MCESVCVPNPTPCDFNIFPHHLHLFCSEAAQYRNNIPGNQSQTCGFTLLHATRCEKEKRPGLLRISKGFVQTWNFMPLDGACGLLKSGVVWLKKKKRTILGKLSDSGEMAWFQAASPGSRKESL